MSVCVGVCTCVYVCVYVCVCVGETEHVSEYVCLCVCVVRVCDGVIESERGIDMKKRRDGEKESRKNGSTFLHLWPLCK